jgi:hypothetical protein
MSTPPTKFEIALNNRDVISNILVYIDAELKNKSTPMDLATAERLMTKLDKAEADLMAAQTVIQLISPKDKIDEHNKQFYDMLHITTKLHSQLQVIKMSLSTATVKPPVVTPSFSSDVSLPRLDIPKFDGNLLEWSQFRDLFTTSVDKSTSLSNAQKLAHLKTLVTGEPLRLIKTLMLTDTNYGIAWSQLVKRYQNDRELLFAIYRRFMSQPSVNPNSASSLRSLLDVSNECMQSLNVLSVKLDGGLDSFLMCTVVNKVDQTSRELWEQTLVDSSIPKIQTLFDFLEQRARSLSAGIGFKPTHRPAPREEPPRKLHAHHTTEAPKCKICPNSHPLFKCNDFRAKTVPERVELVKKLSLCFNCLQPGHPLSKCSSSSRCRTCDRKHHTLIHLPRQERNEEPTGNGSSAHQSSSTPTTANLHVQNKSSFQQSLLATAQVRVMDSSGQNHICRAFLDGGSTSSFISHACVKRLNLKQEKTNVQVVGLSSAHLCAAKGLTSFTMRPHFNAASSFVVNAFVLPKVTSKLPQSPCDPREWSHLQGLRLADPDFHTPADVDILLGSDIFWDLILDGKQTGPPNSPIGINSYLGWLVAGRTDLQSNSVSINHADISLDLSLQKFWEIEHLPPTRLLTPEEEACEDHFKSTHTRDSTGRFIVKLPWKEHSPSLGDSRGTALRRFKQLESRLLKVPKSLEQYRHFMDEYLGLGHMEVVPSDELIHPKSATYFIPHHFVLKEESTTTKFRVVFDASASTTNGKSLNGSMMVGPVIQDNLVDIVMRFRCHPVAFTADIAKMYRQILVTPEDANLQRILWRKSPADPIVEYRLLTVTYGTAAAPFIATRVLQQLAEDEKKEFPIASEIATRDFYVDDVMSGAETVEEAIIAQQQLIEMMERGCLDLRKWSSNSSEVLSSLPVERREVRINSEPPTTTSQLKEDGKGISNIVDITNHFDSGNSVKCLGIYWNTSRDSFEFQVKLPSSSASTKRAVLSEMSKLFDPLGWLSPVVIAAKIFMQSLWKLDLGWDAELPAWATDHWSRYKEELTLLQQLKIPRCVLPTGSTRLELAGFCDASERAYSAVVYLVVFRDNNLTLVSLISSKTRVSPVKTVCLPRLELCGAVLLSQLMSSVRKALQLQIVRERAWTDSTIVLAWINTHPSSLHTFVANRVTEILSNVPCESWFHVPGINNPADCASRGISVEELIDHPLWWHGPSFQREDYDNSAPPILTDEEQEAVAKEERPLVIAAAVQVIQNFIDNLLLRYSSFPKLLRVLAYVRRFVFVKFLSRKDLKGPLSPIELKQALLSIVKNVQMTAFPEELKSLSSAKDFPRRSKIISLKPFIDMDGILRVGGRLRHSALPQDQKTPILLPRHHRLTELIISSKHVEQFHAGPQLIQSLLQQQFWILRAKDAIRFIVRKCIICRKLAASTAQTMMGELPAARVTPGRAFNQCGVDYAGPFIIKSDAPRSKVKAKAYLCIFVCFATRAVHLEVATSLSTDAFLAALRRFVSRRNKPSCIHSDCGTNFIGAARELKEILTLVNSPSHNNKVAAKMSEIGIEWRFNPPGAPHFGGLWEAGVKSVKHHLHRVLGPSCPTYEELSTLIIQNEACLNSRPLTAISSSPDDLNALTPGHFLTGAALNAVPEADLLPLKTGRLDRWQMIQQMHQQFWTRWANEYVTRLQNRPKWLQQRSNIQQDDLVIIKDERMGPQKWKLARVLILHPGPDGIARVATLKTADGEIKRPLVKLCLLPIDNASKNNHDDVI